MPVWNCLFERCSVNVLREQVLDITNKWDKVSNLTYKNG